MVSPHHLVVASLGVGFRALAIMRLRTMSRSLEEGPSSFAKESLFAIADNGCDMSMEESTGYLKALSG